MAVAKFQFRKLLSPTLGEIYRPYALVGVRTKDNKRWIPVETVVDTGADYTILPKRYLPSLGYDALKDCETQTTYGVGGPETVYLLRKIKVKLGDWEQDVPIGFLERSDVPALLGRHEFMELLKTTFDQRVVTFDEPTSKR